MENTLPYEYQSQIDAEKRREALAQALLAKSLGFKGAESSGRIASRTPKTAWMANALTGYLGNAAAERSQANAGEVQQRASADEAAEVSKILALPEDQQVGAATQGKFSRAQALAKVLADRQAKRLEMATGAIKDADPASAFRAAVTGKLDPNYALPPIPDTQERVDAAGNRYITDTNRKGERTSKFAPKAVTVNNVLPGNEAKMGLDVLEAGLKPREEAAVAAKTIYTATARAVDALERGAQAGGLEKGKQLLRSTLQGFGITLPQTAETNELQMALGNALLSEAAKIKPISNTDIDTLREIVGQISSDPTALTRALAYSQAISLDAMQNFEKYVDEQGSTVQNDLARQRLAGVKTGRETPKSLSGPTQFQLEVMRQMQNAGLDITRFNDPTGVPFQQGSKFNVQPAAGFPVGNQPGKNPVPGKKATLPPPKDGQAYTPEELDLYAPGWRGK